MSSTLPILAIVIIAFLVGGCSTTDSTKEAKEIEIFREGGQQPTREYRELGMLTDDAQEVEQPKVEQRMIQKARKMGGDAIIFIQPSHSGSEFKIWGAPASGMRLTYVYRGVVIGYK